MIDYEITWASAINNQIQVKYVSEGKPDYYITVGMQEDFTEADAHDSARFPDHVLQATTFWARHDRSISIESPTGQVKQTTEVPPAYYDPATHVAERTTTETEDEIVISWVIREKSESEVAADVRRRRDELLVLTDTTAFQDRVMSDEMRDYRQALRDIPEQAGFPASVIWPVQPVD